MRSLCVLTASTAVLLAVGGCLTFEMGEVDLSSIVVKLDVPEHIRTIAVPEFVDETSSPGMASEAYVKFMAIADELNRNVEDLAPALGDVGRFPRIVPAGDYGAEGPPDATLSVRLLTAEEDIGLEAEPRFRLTAQVSLVDNHSRRQLWTELLEVGAGPLRRGDDVRDARETGFDDLAEAIICRLLATWLDVDETAAPRLKAPTPGHLYEVGRFYEKRRAYRAALLYYDDLISTFPRSPEAGSARRRIERVRERLTPDEGQEAGE